MISSWRRRREAGRARKKGRSPEENGGVELATPKDFRCPISLELMRDPVTMSSGMTYDRESIEKWIEAGNSTCPVTNQALRTLDPIPNHAIRKMIQDWCVQNRAYGIERIPTPRVPLISADVSEMLSSVEAAQRLGDWESCRELVEKMKGQAKESERNRRRIDGAGTRRVLASVFEACSKAANYDTALLEEILSALASMSPLDEDAVSHLGSAASLQRMVWVLKSCGGLSGKRNAALVLKKVLSSDETKVEALAAIEGAIEAVMKLIKEPICPATTKASLMTLYYMVSNPNVEVTAMLVDMGLVSTLLEMIVNSDRGVCERALGVLDGVCSREEGRQEAYGNALAMPVLVKKLLRVSDVATEFSVSIIWKLCKNEQREEGGVLAEALQFGAFQKLLVLLQVGCGESTKEKATELLKLLNQNRDRLECIDSMDFKNLKRPF